MPCVSCDPVGVVDIAERMGVKQDTVSQWQFRKLLPPPKWYVSRLPAWDWKDIVKWAKESGRERMLPKADRSTKRG